MLWVLKELSQRDVFFEHSKHMFKLIDKKILTILPYFINHILFLQEYKVIVGQEIDKILEKLLEALNKMDDIYRETVVQASEQLRAGLTGKIITIKY